MGVLCRKVVVGEVMYVWGSEETFLLVRIYFSVYVVYMRVSVCILYMYTYQNIVIKQSKIEPKIK